MKSLAVFVGYSKDGVIDDNCRLYINEIADVFDDVIFSSNVKMEFPHENITSYQYDKNGYDFGYFYQALNSVNAFEKYDTIGFFNDSNYVIKSVKDILLWCIDSDNDFCGITDNIGGRPDVSIPDQTHIQTHFIVYKKRAIELMKSYFDKINFQKYLDGKLASDALRKSIIIECEIMMSRYFIERGLKMDAYYLSNEWIPRLNPNISVKENTHIYLWKELIEKANYPLIKRKIYDNSFDAIDTKGISDNKNIFPINMARMIVAEHADDEFKHTL